jgi:hypothetical protein
MSGFHHLACARRYEALVKIALLLTLFAIAPSAEGSPVAEPVPNEIPSIHEQIKADRAKAKADEQNDSKARFWDRDADGKRPWDRPKDAR